MCRAKPYPRCSNHATKNYQKALEVGDPEQIRKARIDYYTSPAGIKHLQETGKTELAEKYKQRRKTLIQRGKRADNLKKTPLRLGLDLDETTGGFIDQLRNEVAVQKGLTPEQAAELMPTPEHYSLVQSGWFADVQDFMKHFKQAEKDGVYLRMQAFAHSRKTLMKMVENRDVEVHVITAREIEWNNDTRTWLRKKRYPIKTITHTESKEDTEGIDVYIDDSDKQITTLQSHGKTVIAYDNKYNESIPAAYRVKNWTEVPAVIKQIRSN